jgi:hypothetical protein
MGGVAESLWWPVHSRGVLGPKKRGMAVYIIKLQRGNNDRTMLRSPNQGYPFSDQ